MGWSALPPPTSFSRLLDWVATPDVFYSLSRLSDHMQVRGAARHLINAGRLFADDHEGYAALHYSEAAVTELRAAVETFLRSRAVAILTSPQPLHELVRDLPGLDVQLASGLDEWL